MQVEGRGTGDAKRRRAAPKSLRAELIAQGPLIDQTNPNAVRDAVLQQGFATPRCPGRRPQPPSTSSAVEVGRSSRSAFVSPTRTPRALPAATRQTQSAVDARAPPPARRPRRRQIKAALPFGRGLAGVALREGASSRKCDGASCPKSFHIADRLRQLRAERSSHDQRPGSGRRPYHTPRHKSNVFTVQGRLPVVSSDGRARIIFRARHDHGPLLQEAEKYSLELESAGVGHTCESDEVFGHALLKEPEAEFSDAAEENEVENMEKILDEEDAPIQEMHALVTSSSTIFPRAYAFLPERADAEAEKDSGDEEDTGASHASVQVSIDVEAGAQDGRQDRSRGRLMAFTEFVDDNDDQETSSLSARHSAAESATPGRGLEELENTAGTGEDYTRMSPGGGGKDSSHDQTVENTGAAAPRNSRSAAKRLEHFVTGISDSAELQLEMDMESNAAPRSASSTFAPAKRFEHFVTGIASDEALFEMEASAPPSVAESAQEQEDALGVEDASVGTTAHARIPISSLDSSREQHEHNTEQHGEVDELPERGAEIDTIENASLAGDEKEQAAERVKPAMRSGKRLWEAAKNSKLVKSKLVTGRKQKLRTLADVARAVRIFHACFEELQDEEEVGVDSLSLSAPATVAVPRREDEKEVPPLAAHEDEPGGGIPGLPQRNRHSSASATSHEDEPGGGIPGLPQRNRHSSASATSSAEQNEDEDPPRSASRSFGMSVSVPDEFSGDDPRAGPARRSFGMSVSVPDEISGQGVPARAASAEMGIGKDTAAGENFAEEEAETVSGGRIPGAEDFPLANGSFATKASPRRSVSFSADKDVILVESAVPSGKNMRKVPNRSGVWRATVESPLGGGDATKEGRVGGSSVDSGKLGAAEQQEINGEPPAVAESEKQTASSCSTETEQEQVEITAADRPKTSAVAGGSEARGQAAEDDEVVFFANETMNVQVNAVGVSVSRSALQRKAFVLGDGDAQFSSEQAGGVQEGKLAASGPSTQEPMRQPIVPCQSKAVDIQPHKQEVVAAEPTTQEPGKQKSTVTLGDDEIFERRSEELAATGRFKVNEKSVPAYENVRYITPPDSPHYVTPRGGDEEQGQGPFGQIGSTAGGGGRPDPILQAVFDEDSKEIEEGVTADASTSCAAADEDTVTRMNGSTSTQNQKAAPAPSESGTLQDNGPVSTNDPDVVPEALGSSKDKAPTTSSASKLEPPGSGSGAVNGFDPGQELGTDAVQRSATPMVVGGGAEMPADESAMDDDGDSDESPRDAGVAPPGPSVTTREPAGGGRKAARAERDSPTGVVEKQAAKPNAAAPPPMMTAGDSDEAVDEPGSGLIDESDGEEDGPSASSASSSSEPVGSTLRNTEKREGEANATVSRASPASSSGIVVPRLNLSPNYRETTASNGSRPPDHDGETTAGKTRDAGVAHKAKVAVPKLSGLKAAAGPRSASPSASALTGMVFPTAMQIRQRSHNRVAGTGSQHAESNEYNPKMNARSSGSVSPVPTISVMSAARGVNMPALKMSGGDNLARSPRSPAARNRFGEIQSNLQSVGGYSPATARRVEERQLEGPRSPRLFHPVGRAENLRASVYGDKSAAPSPPPPPQQFFSTRPLEQEELLARLGNTTSGINLAKASHATTFSQDPLGIEQSPDTPRHRYREMLRAQNIFMSSPTA